MIEAHVDVKASVGYLLICSVLALLKISIIRVRRPLIPNTSRKTYWKNLQLFKTLLNFSFVIKNETQQL